MPKRTDKSYDLLEQKIDLFKDHFDEHMGDVSRILEKIDSRMDNVDVILGKQHVILDEHVKRTNLLQLKIEEDKKSIEDKMEKDKKDVESKIEPIQTHVTQVKLFAKIISIVLGSGAALGGGTVAIKKLIDLFVGM